ncbi:MAG: hypothetical protein HFE62_01400 [Firmicutes bacterium]|nr:hypothetical protein [Bacillota bacterium]
MLPIEEIKKREFNIFEIFSIARTLYRSCIKQILTISIVIGLPVNILLANVTSSMASFLENYKDYFDVMSVKQIEMILEERVFERMGLYYILLIIIQAMLFPLITMAVARVCEDLLYGKITNPFDAMKESFACGAVLILASFIHELLIWSGMLFFIIPAMIIYVILYFYVYAIVLDKKGVISSLKFSIDLVSGMFIKTAGAVIIIFVLDYSLEFTINLLFALINFNYNLTIEILSGVVRTMAGSFFVVATTIYYINRKAVKCGTAVENG